MNAEEVLPTEWFPIMRKSIKSHLDRVFYANPFSGFPGLFRIPRTCFNPQECPMARPTPNPNIVDCKAHTRCILAYPTEKNLEALR